MAGYLNRFISLPFADLGGVDDSGRAVIWVTIRNPRLMAGADLVAAGGKVQLDEHGRPVDSDAAAKETFAGFAKLVLAGHVWDATWVPPTLDNGELDMDAEPPLLPMPPTAEQVAKFPAEILNAIGEELKKANPQPSPAPSSTTTSP